MTTLTPPEMARLQGIVGPFISKINRNTMLEKKHADLLSHSRAARETLSRWQRTSNRSISISREDARGLVLLLNEILGPNTPPGSIMKGLKTLGISNSDGSELHELRKKIASGVN